jgi:DNA-binding beta-propeller fold protein YncE
LRGGCEPVLNHDLFLTVNHEPVLNREPFNLMKEPRFPTVNREPISRFNLFLFLCLAALATAGCASKWSLVADSPAGPLQWRDDLNEPRVRYLTSIRGFKETGTTVPNVIRYIVFGSSADDNTIVRPVAAAVGNDDRIAIADLGRSCVHLYIPSEQKYRKIAGAGNADLRTPVGVAFDDEARLYVSDSSRGAIDVFDRSGEHLFSIKKAGAVSLQRPTGLSYSPEKKLIYVVDTLANRIYAYTTAGDLRLSFGEPGEEGGQFNFPTHIVTAPDGSLYVTDAMNFRVQIFDSAGAHLSSFGHHGNGSGDFAMPKGIAVDKAGVVYVVDTLFDNIQLFNTAGGFLLTVGGRGTGQGEFSLPSGMFLDSRDKLYVCDTYNQRVQIFQVMGNTQ